MVNVLIYPILPGRIQPRPVSWIWLFLQTFRAPAGVLGCNAYTHAKTKLEIESNQNRFLLKSIHFHDSGALFVISLCPVKRKITSWTNILNCSFNRFATSFIYSNQWQKYHEFSLYSHFVWKTMILDSNFLLFTEVVNKHLHEL